MYISFGRTGQEPVENNWAGLNLIISYFNAFFVKDFSKIVNSTKKYVCRPKFLDCACLNLLCRTTCVEMIKVMVVISAVSGSLHGWHHDGNACTYNASFKTRIPPTDWRKTPRRSIKGQNTNQNPQFNATDEETEMQKVGTSQKYAMDYLNVGYEPNTNQPIKIENVRDMGTGKPKSSSRDSFSPHKRHTSCIQVSTLFLSILAIFIGVLALLMASRIVKLSKFVRFEFFCTFQRWYRVVTK